jgi:hypothetical protein
MIKRVGPFPRPHVDESFFDIESLRRFFNNGGVARKTVLVWRYRRRLKSYLDREKKWVTHYDRQLFPCNPTELSVNYY